MLSGFFGIVVKYAAMDRALSLSLIEHVHSNACKSWEGDIIITVNELSQSLDNYYVIMFTSVMQAQTILIFSTSNVICESKVVGTISSHQLSTKS